MKGDPFYFALEFSGQRVPAGLVAELASHVLGHVGCGREALAEVPQSLERAVVASGAADPGGPGNPGKAAGSGVKDRCCNILFRTNLDRLEIVVSIDDGQVWKTSRPISSDSDTRCGSTTP